MIMINESALAAVQVIITVLMLVLLIASLTYYRKREEKYIETLEWYANKNNWIFGRWDLGERAREALGMEDDE